MRFNEVKYSNIALTLLLMTGSDATIADKQTTNVNTCLLKSPSYPFSKRPNSPNLKHRHAVAFVRNSFNKITSLRMPKNHQSA